MVYYIKMPHNDPPYVSRFVNQIEVKREPGKFEMLTNGAYICECGSVMNNIHYRYLHLRTIKHKIAIGELPVGYISCGNRY